jgi:hypothetical protein
VVGSPPDRVNRSCRRLGGLRAYKWSKRQPREPADEKATLHGTAQVLTFKQTKVMDSETASALDGFAFRRNLLGRLTKVGKNAKYVCNIKLAVHIPGRE